MKEDIHAIIIGPAGSYNLEQFTDVFPPTFSHFTTKKNASVFTLHFLEKYFS